MERDEYLCPLTVHFDDDVCFALDHG